MPAPVDGGAGHRGPQGVIDLQAVEELFAEMDAAYVKAAEGLGFSCRDCRDSCCHAKFHHHTVVEQELLRRGLEEFKGDDRVALRKRAEETRARQDAGDRAPCPLLRDYRCSAYAHRPMICRLHGIPSVFVHPRRGPVEGPGCEAFHKTREKAVDTRLDRTEFYRRLSALEGRARAALGVSAVAPRTVAEMILDIIDAPPS